VGSLDGNVYALNAKTGAKLWNYATGSGVWSSPAIANGVVYVGSGEGSFYALNAKTGAEMWSFSGYGYGDPSPVVASGVVYVGSDDHKVYAIGNQLTPTKATVLQDIATLKKSIKNLPASDFRPGGKVLLLSELAAVEFQVKLNHYTTAAKVLQKNMLPLMDGCAKNSAPDNNDLVRTSTAQGQLYPQVQNLIEELQAL
jgi:hypothetical protein